MAKYLFVYHGGSKPETPEEGERVMDQWRGWLASLGDAVVDGGNPVGASSTIKADGSCVDNGGSNPASGYGIFNARDKQHALAIARECPVLDAGGSVELAEIIDM